MVARMEANIIPFFGDKGLSEVTPGLVQEYRVYRREHSRTGKAPARSTIQQELVARRQILKTAVRHGWLQIPTRPLRAV